MIFKNLEKLAEEADQKKLVSKNIGKISWRIFDKFSKNYLTKYYYFAIIITTKENNNARNKEKKGK